MSQCTTTVSNDAMPLQLPSRAQTLNSQAESVTKRRAPALHCFQSTIWTRNQVVGNFTKIIPISITILDG